MSLPPFLAHMGGLPNRIDSAKINGITRAVDTSPVYGQRRAYTGTIDQEIADFTRAARARALEKRRRDAIAKAKARNNRR